MIVVTTTNAYTKRMVLPEEEKLLRLAQMGYDGLDMSFTDDRNHPFWQDGWEAYVENLAHLAKEHGVAYTHAHLPGDTYLPEEVYTRLLKIAGMLGIRYAVLHPLWWHEDGSIIADKEVFIQKNAPKYKIIAEEAGKNGVTLLCENLLWGASIYPEVQSRMVETVNSPWFGWCFDVGHANVFNLSAADICGLKHIPSSLHIHDNHGGNPGDVEKESASLGTDEHQPMGEGSVDWKNFLIMLKKSGYQGEFVLEVSPRVQGEFTPEKLEARLTDLLARARKMVAYYETL